MLKRNSRHVPCRSTTSEKIFMFTIEYAKLQCKAVDEDGSQKFKIICDESHQYHFKMWKNLPRNVIFQGIIV